MTGHRRKAGRSSRRLRHAAHEETRSFLRVLGPLLILTGLVLIVVGFADFFQAFGERGRSPTRFWMCFVGMPLLGIGVFVTKVAFLGATARYVAGEVAPVATDTLNYVAHGAKDAIREVVGAVRDGLREDAGGSVDCPACGERNDADANFCDSCGAALETAVSCPSCGAENDADANFCDSCGAAL